MDNINKQKNERAKFLKEIKEAKEIFKTTQPVLYIGQDIEDEAIFKLVDYNEAGIDIYEDEDLLPALKQKIAFKRRQNEDMTRARRIKAQEEEAEKEHQKMLQRIKENKEREEKQQQFYIQRSQNNKKYLEEQKKIFEEKQKHREPAIVKDVAGMLKAKQEKKREKKQMINEIYYPEPKINLDNFWNNKHEQKTEKERKEMSRNRKKDILKYLEQEEELETAFSLEDPFGSTT